jgi:hypothetical protein
LFIKLPSKSYTDLYVQPQHVAAVFVDLLMTWAHRLGFTVIAGVEGIQVVHTKPSQA